MNGSIESSFCFSFTRCIDGTGQLNFGFAADAIANNDHFLSLSLGPQYNGTVLLFNNGFSLQDHSLISFSSHHYFSIDCQIVFFCPTGSLGFPIDGQGISVGQ